LTQARGPGYAHELLCEGYRVPVSGTLGSRALRIHIVRPAT
jgi:hypothetical protein